MPVVLLNSFELHKDCVLYQIFAQVIFEIYHQFL